MSFDEISEPPRPRLRGIPDDLLTRIVIIQPDRGGPEFAPTRSSWALKNSASETTIISQEMVRSLDLKRDGYASIRIDPPNGRIIKCPIYKAVIGCPDIFPSVQLQRVIAYPDLSRFGVDGLIGLDLLNPN